MTDPTPTDSTPKGDLGLHELVGHALLAGICPLVPIPFLDDWLRDLVRRHQARRLIAAAGLTLDAKKVDLLACGDSSASPAGCVAGCFHSTLMWPFQFLFRLVFKKILRKLVVVLAVKDSVDTFSAVFHETYLLRHALNHPAISNTRPLDIERARAVRTAIEIVRDEVDHRPVEKLARQTFQGSRRLLAATARRATRLLRRRRAEFDEDQAYDAFKDAEDPGLNAVVDELAADIESEAGYLRDLEQRLDALL